MSTRRIVSSVPAGGRVRIHGLGSFTVKRENWSEFPDAIVLDAIDLIEKLNGRPDSVQRCRAAYEAYVAAPTEETREALRTAYVAVPEHNRMYVGDMDTKGVGVRMILFGDQEI